MTLVNFNPLRRDAVNIAPEDDCGEFGRTTLHSLLQTCCALQMLDRSASYSAIRIIWCRRPIHP